MESVIPTPYSAHMGLWESAGDHVCVGLGGKKQQEHRSIIFWLSLGSCDEAAEIHKPFKGLGNPSQECRGKAVYQHQPRLPSHWAVSPEPSLTTHQLW